MEYKILNDGNKIPVLGFGTFQIPNDGTTYRVVLEALKVGYRHIDTAAAYFNEEEVGKAIKDSKIPRKDIFVTSKMWLQDYGYENAKKAIDTSLKKLGLDYIDLYLLHQPYGDVIGAYKALEDAQKEGKIKSIGVSNMTPKLWSKYISHFEVVPAVNQVEFNPYFQQKELRKLLASKNVALEAWGPFAQGNKELLSEPIISEIARKYNKTNGQIILKFILQEGMITFPKSINFNRIKTNFEVFDFILTEEDMDKIRELDRGYGQHNPDADGVAEMLLNAFDIHKND